MAINIYSVLLNRATSLKMYSPSLLVLVKLTWVFTDY